MGQFILDNLCKVKDTEVAKLYGLMVCRIKDNFAIIKFKVRECL